MNETLSIVLIINFYSMPSTVVVYIFALSPNITMEFLEIKNVPTSQNNVSLSSGKRPLVSSSKKSLRMNFLKPQSFPCTNRYALWLSGGKQNRSLNKTSTQ